PLLYFVSPGCQKTTLALCLGIEDRLSMRRYLLDTGIAGCYRHRSRTIILCAASCKLARGARRGRRMAPSQAMNFLSNPALRIPPGKMLRSALQSRLRMHQRTNIPDAFYLLLRSAYCACG